MRAAQKLVSDPANLRTDSHAGSINIHRLVSAAESTAGVEIKGTRNKPFYKFADGSGLTVDYVCGDYKLWPINAVTGQFVP